MSLSKKIYLTVAIVSFLAVPGLASAQNAITAPASKTIGHAKTEVVPSLIVVTARGASLQGEKLTLSGVAPSSIIFADRPVRSAGHALTAHLMEEWASGGSFASDPPNATVSVFNKDASDVRDAVVVLKSPKLDGDRLTFDVQILQGELANADGPASIFIDIIGLPRTPLSFGGVARRTAYRGAFYGGAAVAGAAAVGAAAAYAAPYAYPYAYPYARPACGYYPYPPCY